MATKKKRLPLDRDRVLRAALALADKAGVEALTMRRLGAKLGVEAMSLYKHVANKEEVLDGLVDLLLEQIALPPLGAPWKQALRQRATAVRDTMLEHPWALGLMFDIKPSAARLRHNDQVLGLMREQGFSLELAYRAFLLMDSYIYGFTMQEMSWRAEDPQAVDEMQAAALAQTYPYFSAVLGHVTKLVQSRGARAAYDAEFSYGLDQVLAIIEPR